MSHVHLPVQAGSDRILTAMKRGYSVLEYKSIIRRLKAARPGIAIATDFIVGFPGETAEDFEKTMQLIDDVGFDASFSFVYSPRPGTPAARLPDETPYSVKLERLQRLQTTPQKSAVTCSVKSNEYWWSGLPAAVKGCFRHARITTVSSILREIRR